MQFLLCTLGSAGDVHPVVGIGATLKSRGHDVAVVTNPWFEAAVRDAALEFIPLGTLGDYQKAVENPDLWDPRKGLKVTIDDGIVPSLRPMFDIVMSFDPERTVVTGTLLCFGARIAREVRGYRYASVHIQPAAIPSAYDPPRMPGLPLPRWLPVAFRRAVLRGVYTKMIDPLLGEAARFRESLRLPTVSNYLGSWIHSPDGSLALWPDWYASAQPDWPPHCDSTGFVGWDPGADDPLPPAVSEFLESGDAPIVFTAGSAAVHAHDFFDTAVRACGILGRRAVLVSRSSGQIPQALPSSILRVEWVPFGSLLPRASALVHHGGIGTLAQAFRAGIPQIVMPMAHDQPDNAARIERLGAGGSIAPRTFRPRKVAGKIAALLESARVAARCREIAGRIDFNAARVRAAERLETLSKAPETT